MRESPGIKSMPPAVEAQRLNCWTTKEVARIVLAAAKSLQSYPTLCNPIDGSPPGSPVPGILQERTLDSS